MKKIIRPISLMLTAVNIGLFIPTVNAGIDFFPENYRIENENTVIIEFNKNIAEGDTDAFSVVDASGKDITDETQINITENAAEINFKKIDNSLKYYLRVAEGLESVDGVQVDKAHSYIISKDGKSEDFNNQDALNSWKYSLQGAETSDAVIIENKLLIAGETLSTNNVLYNKNPVLVYDTEYASYDYNNKSVLEYDFCYNIKGTKGNNYDSFAVFFNADEFSVNEDSFSSEKGAYIFRVYNLGKCAELIKWDGSESKIGAENAANKFSIGTVLATNEELIHDTDVFYRYRINSEVVETERRISVIRYCYDEDGTVLNGENILSYKEETDANVGGGFYFMTGSSLKNSKVSYLNSYSVDNVVYSNGKWQIEEYIEPILDVQCSVESNIVEMTFSEDVEYEELCNNLRIYAGDYTNEAVFEIEMDKKHAKVYIENIEADKEYFVAINKNMKSALGYKMSDGYVFNFKTEGFLSSQKVGAERDGEYKMFHSTTKNIDAYLYDSMLYLTKNSVGTNLFEDCDYSGGALVQKADYDKYIYENAILEFDYKNFNTTTVKGNGDFSGMRVYFNADPYVDEMGQWDTNISAEKGAYVLTLYPYWQGNSNSLRLGLCKWDGTKYGFSNRTTLVDNNSTTYGMKSLVSAKNVYDYEPNGKLRIKIETKKLTDAEQIDVYVASYSNDGIGGYEKVLSYIDNVAPYTDGTFYFTACGSNAAYTNGYISTHLVGNIEYMTTTGGELKKIQDIYSENKDKFEELAGKKNVSVKEYNELKYYYTIAQLLKDNGFENIPGIENIRNLTERILSVEDVQYEDDITEHKLKVKFNNQISDEMISREFLQLYCDGELLSDYVIAKKDKGKAVEISVYNDREYDSVYNLSISKDIISTDGMQIDKGYEYAVKEKAPFIPVGIEKKEVNSEIEYSADILNQTSEEQSCFAMLTLISKEAKKETLLAVSVNVLKIQGGDSAPITLMTDYDREDTECRLYIYNSKEEMKKMYKTVTFNEN